MSEVVSYSVGDFDKYLYILNLFRHEKNIVLRVIGKMNIYNNITKHLNLLMIIPYAPTLIRTRPYNLLKGLIRNGHKVTLATLWENEAERKALDEWRALGATVLACELTRKRKFN